MNNAETNLTDLHDRLAITELVNRLFMYTDDRNWQGLRQEVFTENVYLDMESNGGAPPGVVTAESITEGWQAGFQGIDAIHHQAGHYLITLQGDQADVYGYAIATHYRTAALHGKTRTFVGSYDLKAERTPTGWRIHQLKYNLKYADGNASLQ